MFHNIHQKWVSLIAVLAIIILACMCGPGSLLATQTPLPAAPQEPTKSPAPTEFIPTDTPIVEEVGTPTAESVGINLQAEVPWLIISTSDGLWAVNKDGTNPVLLVQKSYSDIDLHRSISSRAHKVAVLVSGQDGYHDLALQVISLPDGKVTNLIKLTNKDTEPDANAGPGDPGLEAMRAIADQPSYAWSPDGKKLAFTAALDKPEADIYIYDLDSQNIQKVSQGDGQDFSPSWSPDEKSILYFEADSFGTGAGYSMKGFWLAAADGSGSKLLDSPKNGGGQILGWRDPETAVLTSWDAMNGTNLLRLYNIHTKKQTILNNGPVSGAAVATGIGDDAGAILYSTDAGLYLLPPGKMQPQKLTGDKVSSYGYPTAIRWKEEGRIFIVHFDGGKLSTFMADGTQQQDAPFNPSLGTLEVGSFGLIWGWTNKGGETEGAWISGPGLATTEILNGPASNPNWNIDNDLLFFVGQDLYRATFSSFYTDPALVASLTGDILDTAWMGFSEALDIKYGP
jgi:hypothetical protein